MGFQRGFKARANRIALHVREKMGLTPVAPINPFKICSHFEIRVIALSELPPDCTKFLHSDMSSFSAMIVPRGAITAIVHNDSHHPHRQRSNVCHELAHCFLGHTCAPPLTSDGDRFHDGGMEAEAHFLAGALLITNEAAFHIMRNYSTEQAQNIYGVSRQMLDYRLRISGAETRFRRLRKA